MFLDCFLDYFSSVNNVHLISQENRSSGKFFSIAKAIFVGENHCV